MTSPPYFRHRDYGLANQIGREANVDDYIDNLVEVFERLRPALTESGSLWLNLGDTVADGALLGIPWSVCLALKKKGWLLVNDVIWHKPNAMPSSTKRRLTVDHEYMFLLANTAGYFYDADAIREPHVTFTEKSRMRGGRAHLKPGGTTPENGKFAGEPGLHGGLHSGVWERAFHPKGRNRRTVWSIPLGKFRGAHFAVFPQQLIEPCIKATTRPGDLVLDPFLGSGTTAYVARSLGRDYLGIEICQEYHKIAQERLGLFT